MRKNFVLDTNVLLDDPHAMFKFADNNVVIPITVIEELDKFKRDQTNLGSHAREATRILDRFREQGNLSKGVPIEHADGGTLRVMTNLGHEPPMPFPTLDKNADSLILATALKLKKQEDLPIVFVTRDINLRLRADVVGLNAQNYEVEGTVDIEEMYSGRADAEVSADEYEEFLTRGELAVGDRQLPNNVCVMLTVADDPECAAPGRRHADAAIHALSRDCESVFGIEPRNQEQAFAFDLLLDDAVPLVTLAGKAGTGKTLLAIAAGMRQVVGESAYAKLVVARPIMPMGKELGFLPGAMGEKMRPWMEPVFDNLELILTSQGQAEAKREPRAEGGGRGRSRQRKQRRRQADAPANVRELLDSGVLEVQALTYIRGRSLPRQFLVIDEAQNLSSHEVKTIITRAGEDTKVVFTGDPYQIDNPFLDSRSNGLSTAVERFKGQALVGHVTLTKGERSPLSELATDLL